MHARPRTHTPVMCSHIDLLYYKCVRVYADDVSSMRNTSAGGRVSVRRKFANEHAQTAQHSHSRRKTHAGTRRLGCFFTCVGAAAGRAAGRLLWFWAAALDAINHKSAGCKVFAGNWDCLHYGDLFDFTIATSSGNTNQMVCVTNNCGFASKNSIIRALIC